jgi:hypothetical protein
MQLKLVHIDLLISFTVSILHEGTSVDPITRYYDYYVFKSSSVQVPRGDIFAKVAHMLG